MTTLLARRRAVAAVKGWDPIQVGGLAAYWNADDLAGGSGASVPAWTDRKGGLVLSQATTTKQPTIVTNALSTGHQAARFTTANAQFMASGVGALPTVQPLWCWVIHSAVSWPQWTCVADVGDANNGWIFAANAAGNGLMYFAPPLQPWPRASLNNTGTGSPLWQFLTFDSGFHVAGGVNGQTPTTVTEASGLNAGSTAFHLGSYYDGTGPLDSNVFLVLIGTGTPTTSDMHKMGTWLYQRYGIICATGYNSASHATLGGISHTGTATTTSIELGVAYNSAGVFGHKYWIAFAPYDGGISDENPNIAYSDDGNTWSSVGITNPIVAMPGNGNNADPTIFDNTARDASLYCYYTRENSGIQNGVRYATSTNGTTWTDQGFTSTTGQYECPTVCYDTASSKYWMYTISLGSGSETIYRQTSSTPTGPWTAQQACTFTKSSGNTIFPWHYANPIKIGSKWVMAISGTKTDSTGLYALWLASSTDGIGWTLASAPFVAAGNTLNWDYYSLYRPAIQDAGDGINLLLWYIGGAGFVSGGNPAGNFTSQMVTVPQSLIP